LLNNPAQQAASAYMNFLARPDAEACCPGRRLHGGCGPFFTPDEGRPRFRLAHREGGKNQYREVWNAG
jgi:hypothetical protein